MCVEEIAVGVNTVGEVIRSNPAVSERIQISMARRIQACINRERRHFEQFL